MTLESGDDAWIGGVTRTAMSTQTATMTTTTKTRMKATLRSRMD